MEEELLPPPPSKTPVSDNIELLPPPPKKSTGLGNSVVDSAIGFTYGIPGVGDLIKTAASTATDLIPQTAAQGIEVGVSALKPADMKQYIQRNKSVEFQKFVRDKEKLPFYKAFDFETYYDKYANEFIQSAGLGNIQNGIDLERPVNIERRLNTEKYVQQQKDEAQKALTGITQDYKDIHNASSLASYIGQALGQGIGQIPISVATGGASSLMMEAAAVYDGQLDELATKYNISREEVIKRGLDKPAEGQTLAILAAGLDAVSSANVLSAFKKAGTKELKESTLKKVLSGFGSEFVTEGAQGNLEKLGATVGAETEFKFDPSSTFNEALSGGIGGGGLSFIGGNKAKKEVSDALSDINKEYTELDSQLKTGDPNVDSQLDDVLAKKDADFIEQISKDAGAIEGNKLDEKIDTLIKNAEEATNAKNIAEREALIAQKALEFSQAPVVPLSQASGTAGPNLAIQEELRQQEDIGAQPVIVPPVAPVEAVAPVKEPVLAPPPVKGFTTKDKRINRKRGKEWAFVDSAGEAKGTIVGNAASIQEIYANTDKEGTPIKGGDLYGKTISKLKENGIKTVVVGAQSPATTSILSKMVEKGILTVDPTGNQTVGGTTYNTRFNIAPTKVKVAPTKPEKVVKPVDLDKIEEQRLEDLEGKRVKLANQLVNATKRPKPGLRLAAIENIAEKADKLGLRDLAEEANKLAQKEYDKKEQAEADKAERKELKTKRAISKPVLSKEERAVVNEQKKEEKKAKEASKSINKPVKVTKGELFDEDTEGLPLSKVRDQYYTELAKNTEESRTKAQLTTTPENLAQYKKILAEYKKFRKDNGLKEMSDEDITKKANTYIVDAKRKLVEAGRQKTRDRKKAMTADLEAGFNAKKEMLEELGFNPDDFDVENVDEKIIKASDELSKLPYGVTKDNTKKVTVEEFVNSLSPSIRTNFIKRLIPLIEKGFKAQGKTLNLFITTAPGDFGVFIIGKNTNLLLVSKNTTIKSATALHELNHGYFELLAHHLNKSDITFSRASAKLYDEAKATLRIKLDTILKKIKENKKLTDEDVRFYKVVLEYVDRFYDAEPIHKKISSGEIILSSDIISKLYGFSNFTEFLVEGFSSLPFIDLLSRLPASNSRFSVKKGVSIMKQLIQELRKSLIRAYSNLGAKYSPEVNSVLDQLENLVENFDIIYEEDANRQFKYDPDYDLISDGDSRDIFYGLGYKDISQDILDKERESGRIKMQNIDENSEYFTIDFKLPKQTSSIKIKFNKEIINKVSKTLEQRENIKDEKNVLDYVNRINKNLPAEKQLSPLYAKLIFKKISKMRKQREEVVKYKVKVFNEISSMPEYKNQDNWKFKRDVDMFNAVDINDLSLTEAKKFVGEFSKFYYKAVISKEAYNTAINFGAKKDIVADMATIADKVNDGASSLQNVTNASTFSTIVAKYQTGVADKIMKNMYSGIMRAFASANTEAHNLDKILVKLAEKNKLTHSDFVRIGAYGSIFSTVNSPMEKELWKEEVINNASHSYESAKNKLVAYNSGVYKGDLTKEQVTEEVKITKDILDTLSKNVSMDKILSKEQRELYDKIREFSDKHSYDFERNAVAIWDKDYIPRYNYFPTIADGRTDGDITNDELLNEGKDNLNNALTGANPAPANNISGKKSGSIEKRTNPKGYYYELDALAISKRHIKNILLDNYGSLEFKIMNRVLDDPKFKQSFSPKLREAFLKSLKNISGATRKFDQDQNSVVKGIMSVRDTLYTTALATMGQSILQASSGFVAAAVIAANTNPAKATKTFATAFNYSTAMLSGNEKGKKLLDWIEKNGLGIQMRDIFFEKYLSAEDYRKGATIKGLKKVSTAVNNFNETPMRKGDKWAATMVWFAAFIDAGGTLDNPTEDAVIRAERAVGVMQNMSDMNFSAPLFKYDSNWKKFAMGMFYAFKSFSLNAEINLIASSRYALSSNEAKKVAAAQFGAILAYRTLQAYIGASLYKSLLGDDDDDEEKTYSKGTEILANSIWDSVIGGWMPAMGDSMARWLFNNTLAKGMFKQDYEEWDQFKNSPIYSTPKAEGAYKTAIGPGFNSMVESTIDLTGYLADYYDSEKFENDMAEAEKLEEKNNIKLLKGFGTIIGASGNVPIPLRGDIKRIIDTIVRIKKKKQREVGNKGSGSGVEFQDGEVPQYELPTYEYNDQNLDLN